MLGNAKDGIVKMSMKVFIVAQDVAQDVVQDLVHTTSGGAAQSASMFIYIRTYSRRGASNAPSLAFGR